MMRFGFGVLRLSSQDFWLLSLLEFASAVDVFFGCHDDHLTQQKLHVLMQNYPDKKT